MRNTRRTDSIKFDDDNLVGMNLDGDELELPRESEVAKVARPYNKKIQARDGEAVTVIQLGSIAPFVADDTVASRFGGAIGTAKMLDKEL